MTEPEIADAYQRYGHLVARRCRQLPRDPAAADDAVQEIFVRLWRYGDAFRAADSKVAWLRRVADRCCFDELARRKRRAEQGSEETAEPGREPRPDELLSDREVVLRFLDRFDDRVKQIAVLHFLDEMTQEEIAQETGWSRQTVAKKLGLLRERAGRLRHLYVPEGRS
jgi:RNA polymerase sigma-70 factor (ECF subfamily)